MRNIYYEVGTKDDAKKITTGNLVFVNEGTDKSLYAGGVFYDFGPQVWSGTLEEYNKITNKDSNTLYLIYK